MTTPTATKNPNESVRASNPWRLGLHICMAVAFGVSLGGIFSQTQFLVKKAFDGTDLQTLIVTSLVGALSLLSVMWMSLYRKLRPSRYALLAGIWPALPMMAIGACHSAWSLIALFSLAVLGHAMHWPLRADLVRRAYPAAGRGRAYAAVAAAETCAAILGVWLFGWAQQQDARAYVWLYPLAGGCSIFGALLAAKFAAVVCDPYFASAGRVSRRRSGFLHLVRVPEAFRAVRVTFRRDPDFFRFERAYMAYGGGWMICFALLPHLVKDKLHLDWTGIALFSQNAMQIFLLLGMLPLGRLADRWGPIRLSAFLFAGLSLYPLGLCLAADGPQLAYVSAGYGLLMAGVHITWNLGPLTLAPTPLKAPLYAAVHTTMVGVRSLLMQPLGVLLFVVSGGFTLPLLVASACFAVGSLGMFRLAKRRARALRLGQTRTVPDATPRVA